MKARQQKDGNTTANSTCALKNPSGVHCLNIH